MAPERSGRFRDCAARCTSRRMALIGSSAFIRQLWISVVVLVNNSTRCESMRVIGNAPVTSYTHLYRSIKSCRSSCDRKRSDTERQHACGYTEFVALITKQRSVSADTLWRNVGTPRLSLRAWSLADANSAQTFINISRIIKGLPDVSQQLRCVVLIPRLISTCEFR